MRLTYNSSRTAWNSVQFLLQKKKKKSPVNLVEEPENGSAGESGNA